jgi:hypothetical protein
MSCGSKCKSTGKADWDGLPFKIAQSGNTKYRPGTVHKQCMDCAKQEMAQAIRTMAVTELASLKKSGRLSELSTSAKDDLENRLTWGL